MDIRDVEELSAIITDVYKTSTFFPSHRKTAEEILDSNWLHQRDKKIQAKAAADELRKFGDDVYDPNYEGLILRRHLREDAYTWAANIQDSVYSTNEEDGHNND